MLINIRFFDGIFEIVEFGFDVRVWRFLLNEKVFIVFMSNEKLMAFKLFFL